MVCAMSTVRKDATPRSKFPDRVVLRIAHTQNTTEIEMAARLK